MRCHINIKFSLRLFISYSLLQFTNDIWLTVAKAVMYFEVPKIVVYSPHAKQLLHYKGEYCPEA